MDIDRTSFAVRRPLAPRGAWPDMVRPSGRLPLERAVPSVPSDEVVRRSLVIEGALVSFRFSNKDVAEKFAALLRRSALSSVEPED